MAASLESFPRKPATYRDFPADIGHRTCEGELIASRMSRAGEPPSCHYPSKFLPVKDFTRQRFVFARQTGTVEPVRLVTMTLRTPGRFGTSASTCRRDCPQSATTVGAQLFSVAYPPRVTTDVFAKYA